MIPECRHDEFRALWLDETASSGYIREVFKVSWKTVDNTRRFLGLPEREHRNCFVWAPSESEIEERAAEMRARWSPAVRDSRSSDRVQRVEVQSFNYDRRSMSFS